MLRKTKSSSIIIVIIIRRLVKTSERLFGFFATVKLDEKRKTFGRKIEKLKLP